MNHFISLKYLSAPEIKECLALAKAIKGKPSDYSGALEGKFLGLLFEKPSLRTKTAFYIGALQLGAQVIYYTPQEVRLGERESIRDVSRTLSGYLDAVVLRTFSHAHLLEFAKFSVIPVINGLSDLFHPSQALADVLTIQELKGDIKDLKVVYVGDANNVCNSLIYVFSILGGNLTLVTPDGYSPSGQVLNDARDCCVASGAKITYAAVIEDAAKDADVLYTDVWISMGKEAEEDKRKKAFKNFQINDKIVARAKKDCIIMHCLPAHRGQEITDSVIDGGHSAVFVQSRNRLYAAKAILLSVQKQ
jgi:ornithine carbamoyltransferase